jgi:hypothetical protein
VEGIPKLCTLALGAIRIAGGKRKFIDYARYSADPEVAALVARWDSLSKSDRQALAITDMCHACGLEFADLFGQVSAQAFRHNANVAKLMAAVSQPRVVKATVDSAIQFLGPDGVKDRQMLHTHSNFLPVPKSASTIFHLQQQINNNRESGRAEMTTLPSFEEDIIAFNSALRTRVLPASMEPEKE